MNETKSGRVFGKPAKPTTEALVYESLAAVVIVLTGAVAHRIAKRVNARKNAHK